MRLTPPSGMRALENLKFSEVFRCGILWHCGDPCDDWGEIPGDRRG